MREGHLYTDVDLLLVLQRAGLHRLRSVAAQRIFRNRAACEQHK
jgi:hypothetical protein